jgi:hypothetical protein
MKVKRQVGGRYVARVRGAFTRGGSKRLMKRSQRGERRAPQPICGT